MARRKKRGRPVSGWLILDKPQGMTSTRAVAIVKRLFDAQKAGHAGTLDPLATGSLPIALGEATKSMSHVLDAGKAYRFTVSWGTETDTDDSEGEAIATRDDRPTREAIKASLPALVGAIEQLPPRYSAIKIDGERAYDIARDGEEPALAPRTVFVESFDLVDIPDNDHAVFEVSCGKGTYVRSMARDLGRALGCLGHVSELRRLYVDPFEAEELVDLPAIEAAAEAGGAEACDAFLLPVETALAGLLSVRIPSNDTNRVLRGQAVLLRGADAPTAGPAYATGGGQLLAIGEIEAGAFHPKRVFHL